MSEWIARLFRKKYFIILLVFVLGFSLLFEAYHFFIGRRFQSMVLTLNYPGSEDGLNPNGSRFNSSELKSDEIIDKARAKLTYSKYSTEYLKTRLYIGSRLPLSATEDTINSIKSGETYTYMPSSFTIYYSQKNKLAPNEANDFLHALASTYKEYFDHHYPENNTILDFKSSDYDFTDYDYAEIYTVLNDKLTSMLDYLKEHQSENSTFKSSVGITFPMILAELDNLKNTELITYYSYVMQNSIAKDKASYTDKTEYLKSRSQLSYDKEHGASDILKTAIEKYNPNIAGVVFVPSVDDDDSFYMSRTKTGIDDLTKDSYDRGVKASVFSGEIDGYNNILNKFANAPESTEDQKKQADKMISELMQSISKLSDRAISLDDEYIQYKTRDYITFRIPDDAGIISLSAIIKGGMAGFISGVAAILALEILIPKIDETKKRLNAYIEKVERIKRKQRMGAEK